MGYAFFDFSAKAPVFFLFVFSGGQGAHLPPRHSEVAAPLLPGSATRFRPTSGVFS